MSLDITKLFNWSYLTAARPEPNSDLIFVVSLVFAILLIASAIVWLLLVRREKIEPVYAKAREFSVRWLFTTGFVGLILVFFRWQGLPYLGSRFWLLAWLIASVVWLGFLVRYLLKKFPKERKMYAEQKLKERYLPRASASH